MKFPGISEHRQNVLCSVLLMAIMAIHHPFFSPGSTGFWDQIEWHLGILVSMEKN